MVLVVRHGGSFDADFCEYPFGQFVVPMHAAVGFRVLWVEVEAPVDYVAHHDVAVGFVEHHQVIGCVAVFADAAAHAFGVLELHDVARILVEVGKVAVAYVDHFAPEFQLVVMCAGDEEGER